MSTVDLAVLAALDAELAPLEAVLDGPRIVHGVRVFEGELAGARVRAAVGGVGKVAAARAAALLVEPAPRLGLVVVGVCGGLSPNQPVGTLVHCSETVQCDLHLPIDRSLRPDPRLAGPWREAVPGALARFLTADRAAMTPWRRLGRRLRFGPGPAVADMETAAAAWVASRAGVPWAALRAVSDTQGLGSARSFKRHFPVQAPRAAATVAELLRALATSPQMEPRP